MNDFFFFFCPRGSGFQTAQRLGFIFILRFKYEFTASNGTNSWGLNCTLTTSVRVQFEQ